MHQLYHIILIFDQLHFANTLPHPHIVRYKLMDGWTGHFVFPDLPEHTTTCGASGPNIRNLVPDSTVHILHGPYFVITTVSGFVHVRYYCKYLFLIFY